LLLITFCSAQAQDFNALFTSSTSLISSENLGTTTDLESFAQTLDLNWNKTISPTLRYRLTLRSTDDRNQIKVDSDVTRTSATQVEPILDATLSSYAFALHGGYRARELFSNGNNQDAIWLDERRWFTRLFLTPQDLPAFNFQIDRFTQENDINSVNQTDTRYQIGTNYEYGGATFSYVFSDRINKNIVAGQTRDQKNSAGTVGYTGNSLWGWLDVLAGYSINYTPIHEEFSKNGIAEVERQLSRGLKAAADISPLDSSDVPLTNEPGLVNGSASVPLDLNISIGFEQLLQPPKAVSKIRINLAAGPSLPIIPDNLQAFLKFKVFISDKPDPNAINAWTEIGGFSQTYDPLESRFELTWPSSPTPPPTARFVKVWVDANLLGPSSILATKITALNLEPVTAGTKRDENTLSNNVSGSFTVRPPTRPWTISAVSYDFNLSHSMQQPGAIRNISGTQTARLIAEPFRYLTSTFTYQHNFTDSNQEGNKAISADLYSLVLTSAPLSTLTSSLTLSHNDNRGNSKIETRTDMGSLNVSARLYRDLNVDSTYSLTKTQDFLTDQKTLTHSATINASALLTPRLNATLSYAIRWLQTEQPQQNTTDLTNSLNSSFTYTISRFLNLTARYDFLTSNDVTAFNQDYRVDWSPTPKLSGFVGYHRMQQDSNGEKTSSDAVNVNARWNISRYLNLETNFIFFTNSTGNNLFGFSGRAQIRF
jgi:hypothetical protein